MDFQMLTKTPELEIETKWSGAGISRENFLKVMRALKKRTDLHTGCTYKHDTGPDIYMNNKLGYVARLRFTSDKKEITVKARLSKTDITKRVEYNIPLDESADLKSVQEAWHFLGFDSKVEITKTCDVFDFKLNSGICLHVAYYVVRTKNHKDRIFIEVEPENGTVKQKMKALKEWSKLVSSMLGLQDSNIINQSLYEIYSGHQYRAYKVA